MTFNRISFLISVFGVLAGVLMLYVAVDEHHSGASSRWIWSSAAVCLCALLGLVRDVRQLRTRPAA
ncbi:hypothetical protein [Streptomyces sp. NPDC001770]